MKSVLLLVKSMGSLRTIAVRRAPFAVMWIQLTSMLFGQQQTVFFSPLDPIYRPLAISGGGGYPGSLDYMDLFTPNAPWANAAGRIHVFEPYIQWIGGATDAQLIQMFTDLASRRITLGIEISAFAFPTATGCGEGVESFQGAGVESTLQKIKRLGGDLQWVFFDNPIYYGSYYNGPNACRWPLNSVVANLLPQVATVRRIFPNARIGTIEGIGHAPDWQDRLKSYIAMYRQATGSNPAALRVDAAGFFSPNWKDDAIAFSRIAAREGIPFGIIYQGSVEQSSAEWMNAARQHVMEYELGGGTPPSHVVFQSWTQYPEYSLPETNPSAFTSIVNWYFRRRTSLTLNTAANGVGGRLVDSNGAPLPGSPIQITATPAVGSGVVATYTITGTVPAGLRTALVGIRVNNECDCQGVNDVTLYSFQYRENSASTPVATLDFANGLSGWGLGPGAATLERGPPAYGQGLHITAQPTQAVMLNSRTFAVTPGASFVLQITARVSPNTAGSGYFLIVFLTNPDGTGESTRQHLWFQPATLTLGRVDTVSDGSFFLPLPPQDLTSYRIQASYAGTETLWAARSATIATGPLRFVALDPCRVMETRSEYNFQGRTGSFGPPNLRANETRTLNLPMSSVCQVPSTANAYLLNVTLVPRSGGVNYVTLYPAGENRPQFFSARSPDGQIVANSAIVKAGTNGGIDVFSTNDTDMLIDIAGYFTDNANASNLVFYPLTPCRAVETRLAYGSSPWPYGPPSAAARQTRRIRLPGAPPPCSIPNARAYSMTITAVPSGPLQFITAWPSGGAQPNVSSLNSPAGRILANTVILPASTDGSIDVFTFDRADFLVDINGYYAPDDGSSGLFYYPVTQCRAADSTSNTLQGSFGAPIYEARTTRTLVIPDSPGCSSIPRTAKAYVVNVTALPNGAPMPFITAHPSGQARPNASILNAFQGQIVTNTAIVPTGANGAIDVFAFGRTHVIVEISGYFGR